MLVAAFIGKKRAKMTAAGSKNFLMHGMRTAKLATELIVGAGLCG